MVSTSTSPARDGPEPLTETSPLAQLLAIGNLDERDAVLAAKSDDQLLVSLLLARLVEDAHVRLATVESLGCFAEAAGEAVVDQGELEDTLESVKNGHLALGSLGRNLDLRGDLGSVVLFYVRLGQANHSMLASWNLEHRSQLQRKQRQADKSAEEFRIGKTHHLEYLAKCRIDPRRELLL